VSASIDTVRGPVASPWTKTGHSFTLGVTVAVNASATVSVPLFGAGSAHAGHGAALLRVHDGIADYAVGSGHWQFTDSM
jgi:alpha-L-rhamnosidase